MNQVEIESAWGATFVRAQDPAGNEHRFWFDETAKGRVILCAQIVYIEETDYRDYVPRREWSVPDDVQKALIEHGLSAETIRDTRGFKIA